MSDRWSEFLESRARRAAEGEQAEAQQKKTASIERLPAEVESLDCQVDTMGTDNETLRRDAEKTIADTAAGVEAGKSALVVLREFYDRQAALLQQGQAPGWRLTQARAVPRAA